MQTSYGSGGPVGKEGKVPWGASASPTIIPRFVALPGDFSRRQSKWKGGRQGQCCISVGPALEMGPRCSGLAPCVERLTIAADS